MQIDLTPQTPAVGRTRASSMASGSRHAHQLEMGLTLAGLLMTLVAVVLFLRESYDRGMREIYRSEPFALAKLAIFVMVVLMLVYGNVVYQLCRLGYIRRTHRHFGQLDQAHEDGDGHCQVEPLVVLVPSYKEDLRTMRQTLLSAALQDYPNRRVVLLLDDPFNPRSPEDIASLAAARRLPGELNALLGEPRLMIDAAQAEFEMRSLEQELDLPAERDRLLAIYGETNSWLSWQAATGDANDHTDDLFNDLTFLSLHEDIRRRIDRSQRSPLDAESIRRAYTTLAQLFHVEISAFERKRYANLSHAPNKAANLNAYLALLGKSVREVEINGALQLVTTTPDAENACPIPDATYVITLDADSLLRTDYARRLVAVMEAPGHGRYAVVQTPYTAIPGAPSTLERIAGATTDIQYVIHQGFTHYNATYWVGANALLRMEALRDIQGAEIERGFTVPVFIKDRTVIEDTESTIDLVSRGWSLYNYPERLAFSATPPDFGSLLIQRRRWANGGLLIMPNLIRHGLTSIFERGKAIELFVRAHYLISIAGSSLGLLVLLFLPLGKGFDSPWLPLAAIPYFLLYARDLSQIGYRKSDVLRVYAFNLLLLPINLAGVLKSLQQAITGAKIPFGRTPKTEGRTAAPSWAILAEWLMLLFCLAMTGLSARNGHWINAGFTFGTAVAFGYAIVAFVGLRPGFEDLAMHLRGAAGRWSRLICRQFTPSRSPE